MSSFSRHMTVSFFLPLSFFLIASFFLFFLERVPCKGRLRHGTTARRNRFANLRRRARRGPPRIRTDTAAVWKDDMRPGAGGGGAGDGGKGTWDPGDDAGGETPGLRLDDGDDCDAEGQYE